jgi:N utilization substance protein B
VSSARRLAREGLIQGLYQWQFTAATAGEITTEVLAQPTLKRADQSFFKAMLGPVMEQREQLGEALQPFLDRPLDQLSPIERSILWLGAYELLQCQETPLRVIINEAVELAKRFGGTDGHRYVNGVLDHLAAQVRPEEFNQRQAANR